MKKISTYIFIVLLIASISLTIISLKNKEWESVTATISLIIAIISGWIAYETFYRQNQAEKAQIVVKLDFTSRYDVILLVVENLGLKPAFNITLNWNQELRNLKGEKIRFNKFNEKVDIPVLNPSERTSVLIDVASRFYSKRSEKDMDYDGTVKFQESLNSKRQTSYPFHFSFKHYNLSPAFENETPKTMFELQKIPDKLESIKQEINNITKQLKT
jgi:hypothetical protein